ncbi:MAG: AMP-binding protein [Verrucomicrobia bacterium]|nr:AMP-binding protein [Verrucomicrobiota bacterium]
MAAQQPHTPALKVPRGRTRGGDIDYLVLSFAELAAEVAAWRHDLAARGVRKGDRVLVMVRQGLPLIAAAFALFELGAVPVVIDPGMGLKSFLACVARSRPRVLLGIPLAQLISRVFRKSFRGVALRIRVSGSPTARRNAQAGSETRESAIVRSAAADLAAILFTSGSTGAPKGVCYTHGMFAAQVRLIRDAYGIQPGEIDLPMLPVFALFNPALGLTTIVPEIDPSRPARVDPAKILQAIRQENVTSSFGSPTLWRKIAAHCHHHRQTLPTMKRVLCAGAPVPPDLWELLTPVLTGGTLHSPYGATEALPVSSISAAEVQAGPAIATQHGAGTCVGRVLAANEVKIIAITADPIAALTDVHELPSGEIGEIVVRGPTVTQVYDALPEATAAAKIRGTDDDGVWHRMGDTGYLDANGLLWYCGRKAERVETSNGPLYTEQVEPLFIPHAEVNRAALIGLGEPGRQRPALVIEPVSADGIKTSADCRRLARELRAIALRHPHTAAIKLFYFHPRFPVDVRHNAKIHRLALARWAVGAVGYESDPKR